MDCLRHRLALERCGVNWLRIKRLVGLAAPEDGLCSWTWDRQSVTSYGDRVRYETDHFKCVLPWGHGSDHDARIVEPQRATDSPSAGAKP